MERRCTHLRPFCKKCGLVFEKGDRRETCECGQERRCQRAPVLGISRCSFHGGGYPLARGTYGVVHPVTTATTTKRFPLLRNAKLLEQFQEAEKDPELISLRGALAMVKVRIFNLIDRIDTGESAGRWKQAIEAWNEYKAKRGSVMEVPAYAALDNVMTEAYHDYMSWKQIFDALDLERKLSESEQKRLTTMSQMMTAEDLARIVTQLQAAIIRVIDDPQKLKLIEWEFIRITGIGNLPESKPSRGSEEELFDASGLDSVKLLDS